MVSFHEYVNWGTKPAGHEEFSSAPFEPDMQTQRLHLSERPRWNVCALTSGKSTHSIKQAKRFHWTSRFKSCQTFKPPVQNKSIFVLSFLAYCFFFQLVTQFFFLGHSVTYTPKQKHVYKYISKICPCFSRMKPLFFFFLINIAFLWLRVGSKTHI